MHATNDFANHSADANFRLVTKPVLADQLKLSVRSIDNLVRRKAIPIIRLSPRCVRFDLKAVRRALGKFEIMEAGRRA